ncbi:MAG: hypothetical protein ING89_09510 [Rubrivivax sp.]|nr:hypothetical protein [Rubrivivax sp.]
MTFASGGAEQTLATVAGQSYAVSSRAGNSCSSGRDGNGVVNVSIDAPTLASATADATTSDHVWAERSFSVVAKSISTTIRLRNDQNPVAHFAVIDGVSAMASTPGAVPKPGSLGPAGIPPPRACAVGPPLTRS